MWTCSQAIGRAGSPLPPPGINKIGGHRVRRLTGRPRQTAMGFMGLTKRADLLSSRVTTALPSSLSFDRQFHIHRALFLCERTAQLGKRNILQLPNALSRDTKFFTYFLKRLRLPAVQTKTLEDDL